MSTGSWTPWCQLSYNIASELSLFEAWADNLKVFFAHYMTTFHVFQVHLQHGALLQALIHWTEVLWMDSMSLYSSIYTLPLIWNMVVNIPSMISPIPQRWIFADMHFVITNLAFDVNFDMFTTSKWFSSIIFYHHIVWWLLLVYYILVDHFTVLLVT